MYEDCLHRIDYLNRLIDFYEQDLEERISEYDILKQDARTIIQINTN